MIIQWYGQACFRIQSGQTVIFIDPFAKTIGLTPPRGEAHIVLVSHHHPDHTVNIALFPNAEVVDFWARYRDDLWLDHDGDGYALSPRTRLWLTPGHTEEDASLIIEADDATYALTHLWWKGDRTPVIDPLAWDQGAIERGRERVLTAADIVIPGHGEAFRVRP